MQTFSALIASSDKILQIGSFFENEIDEAAPQRKKIQEAELDSQIGVFDLILCKEQPIKVEKKTEKSLIQREGEKLVILIEKILPEITKIQYTDQDFDTFCEEVGKFHLDHLSQFLFQLKKNGQITENQYERAIKEYQLNIPETAPQDSRESQSILPLILNCLKHHMRKGSLLVGFLEKETAKSEDPDFLESIIANPFLDYQEISIQIGKQIAPIFLIKKQSDHVNLSPTS